MKYQLRLVLGIMLTALLAAGCGKSRRGHPKAYDPNAMVIPAGLPDTTQAGQAVRPALGSTPRPFYPPMARMPS
jgi:hypothetical protein